MEKIITDLVAKFDNSNIDGFDLNERIDNFSEEYCLSIHEANEFLDKFKGSDLTLIISELISRYNDNNLICDWIDDKIQLANEIVGYLVRESYGVN